MARHEMLEPALRPYVDRAATAAPAWETPIADLRAGPELEVAEVWGELPSVREIEDDSADGVPVRVYRGASGAAPTLVWLHGGGWAVGSIASHDPVFRRLAATTPCTVVAPDYRLAPESPFPAGLEDALACVRWAVERADGAPVAVGGDSAGGNLAAVVARRLRDEGIELALQVLAYPVTDHHFETASYLQHGTGLNLTRVKMEWYWSLYLAGADPHHPDASPLRATDLAGVAPALVQVAEYDPLLSEGVAYAELLERSGVPVRLTRYPGVIHGFLRMAALTPAATAGLDEIAAALRDPTAF